MKIESDLGLNINLEDYVRWLAKVSAFEVLRNSGLLEHIREVAALIDWEEGVFEA